MTTEIEKARATFRDAFRMDPGFRRVYQDNIAMLLHDRHGIVGHHERDAAAEDIINLVFGERDMTVKDEREFWEKGIEAEAKRAGIDTRGMVGMAILHAMVDRIIELCASDD